MLNFNEQLHNAITRATQYHKDQNRKMSTQEIIPYVSHPFAVALILSEFTHDTNVLIAALLHDLPEDTDYNLEKLKQEFGEKIYTIVSHLTEIELKSRQETTWEERKVRYFKLLETAPEETLLVVSADKIHNLKSMIYSYKKVGNFMWDDFNDSGKDKQLWFHGEVLQRIKKKFKHPIVAEHEHTYNEALDIL